MLWLIVEPLLVLGALIGPLVGIPLIALNRNGE